MLLSSLPSTGGGLSSPEHTKRPWASREGTERLPSPPPTHNYLWQSWKLRHDSPSESRVPLCGEKELRGLGWGPRGGTSWWPPPYCTSSAPQGQPVALGLASLSREVRPSPALLCCLLSLNLDPDACFLRTPREGHWVTNPPEAQFPHLQMGRTRSLQRFGACGKQAGGYMVHPSPPVCL